MFAQSPSTTANRLLYGLLTMLLLLHAGSAFAQTNRPRSVAVLDFTVPPTRNDTIVSRQTTDAFAQELQHTGTYEVAARNQVEQVINDLELSSPLTLSNLTKLGESLGVDYIAIGRLLTLSNIEKPERVQASLQVLFFDVATGEFANGARVNGVISKRSSDTPDTSNFSAISDAAFNAARTINSFQLPEATVLHASSDTVLLNGGERNGIHAGQEFIILRRGQRVGRVRITDVSGQDAHATIIDYGKGIRPEDKARAVVSPADLPSHP